MKSSQGKYQKVAVGGTFDQFHKGHRKLIRTAFEVGEKVVIGVSGDGLVKELHKPHKVDCFPKRISTLRKHLNDEHLIGRAEIIELKNRFGITVSDPDLDALVVSRRSKAITSLINDERVKRGLLPIRIITIDMVLASDKKPISTTRIRRGKIDREGRLLK